MMCLWYGSSASELRLLEIRATNALECSAVSYQKKELKANGYR